MVRTLGSPPSSIPSSKISAAKTEEKEENKIKIELIEPEDSTFQRQPEPTTKTIICTDNEFLKLNNVKMDIKIEEYKIQPCHVRLNRCLVDKRETTQKPRYECYICGYSISRVEKLRCHMSTHFDHKKKLFRQKKLRRPSRPFSCDECSKTYATKKSVKIHKQLHLGKTFACKDCAKTFATKRYLNSHRRHHTDQKNLECKECPKKFFSITYLNKHIRAVHEKPFACDECPMKFQSEKVLDNHRETHSAYWSKTKTYQCYICKCTKNQCYTLRAHMRIHTGEKPFACDKCPKKYSLKVALYSHKVTHRDKLFECEKCRKKFHTKNGLGKHKMIHLEDKPFKCDGCHRSFLFKQILRHHKETKSCNRLSNYLPIGAKFECYMCPYASKQHSAVRRHMVYHFGIRRFACDECPKKYLTTFDLDVHKSTHSTERPFSCTVCSKTFKNKCYLGKHILHNHTKKKELIFVCRECSKKFSLKGCLKRHELTHLGKLYSCDECPKKYLGYSGLMRHKRFHKGIQRFECDFCPKKFYEKDARDQHHRVHTGEGRIPCEICDRIFVNKLKFAAHQERCKTIPCKLCKRQFSCKSDCTEHERMCKGPKPFHCSVCLRKFKNEKDLSLHIELHSYSGKLKYFECYVCKYSARYHSVLIGHMRQHTGEKPFNCVEFGCNKAFTIRKRLLFHQRTYHSSG